MPAMDLAISFFNAFRQRATNEVDNFMCGQFAALRFFDNLLRLVAIVVDETGIVFYRPVLSHENSAPLLVK